jgi:adenine/guanine phosphoribosyltransferase-like PRPP-binding protein
MSIRIVEPQEFQEVFCEKLLSAPKVDFVTGPGRSGAIAAVYASHFLGVPYVPFKRMRGHNVLIVDTAVASGRTLRKASKFYHDAPTVFAFMQPPRVKFWYERLSMVRGKGNEFRVAA